MVPKNKSTTKSIRSTTQRSFLHRINEEQYMTLLELVQGTFTVPKSKRTKTQINALRNYQRRKKDFHVELGKLCFKDKIVVPTSSTAKIVKSAFKQNLGSGSKSTWRQLKQTKAGVSLRAVKGVLGKSKIYQQHRHVFKNKVPPKSIKSNSVNERWQIDLLDMRSDQVLLDGKPQRYILSILDTFSRFLFLRPMARKTSENVANILKRVFADHGIPKIIQCDQGTEFKGEVQQLLTKKGVKIIRSSPYHPQSQGKCERSHKEVRNKIAFKMKQKSGYNWASHLFEIQEAINNIPKEVLGNKSPAEVFENRGNISICQKVQETSLAFNLRKLRKFNKRTHAAVYRKDEKIFIRYPPKGGSKLVPRRRYTVKGVVEERDLANYKYKVRFRRPDGKEDSQWILVSDMIGITAHKEKMASKRTVTDEIQKERHKRKYYIPVTHKDRIQGLHDSHTKVLLDPRETVGSCQFESVSHQLSLFGIYRTSATLRHEATQHVREFPELYKNFVTENIESYINKMALETTYGDHVTLVALSRIYHIQILIVSTDGPEYTTFISPDGSYNENTFLLTLGYFPEDRGEHYVSIVIDNEKRTELLSQVCDIKSDDERATIHFTNDDDERLTIHSTEERATVSSTDDERATAHSTDDEIATAHSTDDEISKVHSTEDDRETIHPTEEEGASIHSIDNERALIHSNGDERAAEFLPRDIQCIIIHRLLELCPASRYTLQLVNTFFRYIVSTVPLPRIHISWSVLQNIPNPVSVRRLIRRSGRGSGLALEIRNILANPRWSNAWLRLREEDNRNFFIVNVWYRVDRKRR